MNSDVQMICVFWTSSPPPASPPQSSDPEELQILREGEFSEEVLVVMSVLTELCSERL